jgi:hypothetical protein
MLNGGDTGNVSYDATDLAITVEVLQFRRAQLLPLQRIEYPERSGTARQPARMNQRRFFRAPLVSRHT